jgi:hypothetical protein
MSAAILIATCRSHTPEMIVSSWSLSLTTAQDDSFHPMRNHQQSLAGSGELYDTVLLPIARMCLPLRDG